MLDMMHSFLQDAPQLIFQVFLLYRRPELITGTLQESPYSESLQGMCVWDFKYGMQDFTLIYFVFVFVMHELNPVLCVYYLWIGVQILIPAPKKH